MEQTEFGSKIGIARRDASRRAVPGCLPHLTSTSPITSSEGRVTISQVRRVIVSAAAMHTPLPTWVIIDVWKLPPATSAMPLISTERRQNRMSQHLDHRHDYVCLNFGSNLAAAMFVRNRGSDVVRCSFQFSRFSGLDFVAKKSSLTIGNGRKAR